MPRIRPHRQFTHCNLFDSRSLPLSLPGVRECSLVQVKGFALGRHCSFAAEQMNG